MKLNSYFNQKSFSHITTKVCSSFHGPRSTNSITLQSEFIKSMTHDPVATLNTSTLKSIIS